MQYTSLTKDLSFSRIIQGFWRLDKWQQTPQQTLTFIHQLLELGITTFDHAACYGGFTTEGCFGQALALDKSLREKMTLVSKCGILYPNQELPEIKSHYYDNSYEHIVWSAERSIQQLQCEQLDVLLIHRLSPCADPEQIARAFEILHQAGKVRHFGVSNYTPAKFSMLQSYVKQPLITNQIEISPLHLNAFDDGSLDFLLEKRIKPMAWSPLAGGRLFDKTDKQGIAIATQLLEIGKTKDEDRLDVLALAWLLSHPAHIMPILGSGNIERVRNAADALKITFTEEEWIKVYVASQGFDIP
ncbi:aldo/keto reductase [Mannheimia sp. AT1]|uniref:Aldo/keto reductase n=1 Tax=Mannheimia cairinae TaxID=3025936 RepID=A0ABT5MRG0_9PAST|nr:aldo/keto reductase [Mannheimia cairinae]MDD0824770.1 aldo/keto reductase [Mannheimia cairinae]MDD0826300.1 aldo/keto reductase [Mannheimia cairinae]